MSLARKFEKKKKKKSRRNPLSEIVSAAPDATNSKNAQKKRSIGDVNGGALAGGNNNDHGKEKVRRQSAGAETNVEGSQSGANPELANTKKKKKVESNASMLVELHRDPGKSNPNTAKSNKASQRNTDLQRDGHGIVKNYNLYEDSGVRSKEMFSWLISPCTLEDYNTKYWEKTFMHLKRPENPDYYSGWFHKSHIEKALEEKLLYLNRDIDIACYQNGVRYNLTPTENKKNSSELVVADSDWVWRQYKKKGASLRLKCPQCISPELHKMLFILEDSWGSGTSANVYLTPARCQGFAPHYDDVEVFILQIEGKKRWRLYPPVNRQNELDRFPSRDFAQSELGEPMLDTVLMPGDLLCLPRGTIHQAISCETHSLHITVSAGYHSTYADFLEIAFPKMMQAACKEMIEMKRSIPRDIFEKTQNSQFDPAFNASLKASLFNMLRDVSLDAAISDSIDSMAKTFLHSRLPDPFLCEQNERHNNDFDLDELGLESQLKLKGRNSIRLIEEDNVYRLYFSCSNSIRFQSEAPKYIEVEELMVPAIYKIVSSYPDFLSISELDLDDDETKLDLATALYEYQLIDIKI